MDSPKLETPRTSRTSDSGHRSGHVSESALIGKIDSDKVAAPVRQTSPSLHQMTEAHIMTTELSSKARELIQRPVIANVATVDSEGRPQVTPVWIDLDGDDLVFNTAKGRTKDLNLEKNPHVAISVVDPDDPYNVVVVRGKVEEIEDGADAHIDSLAKKYLGVDTYPMRRPNEVRVKYRIHADKVVMQPAEAA
jgi:PPOX class probable F420-dependent enzyme